MEKIVIDLAKDDFGLGFVHFSLFTMRREKISNSEIYIQVVNRPEDIQSNSNILAVSLMGFEDEPLDDWQMIMPDGKILAIPAGAKDRCVRICSVSEPAKDFKVTRCQSDSFKLKSNRHSIDVEFSIILPWVS